MSTIWIVIIIIVVVLYFVGGKPTKTTIPPIKSDGTPANTNAEGLGLPQNNNTIGYFASKKYCGGSNDGYLYLYMSNVNRGCSGAKLENIIIVNADNSFNSIKTGSLVFITDKYAYASLNALQTQNSQTTPYRVAYAVVEP